MTDFLFIIVLMTGKYYRHFKGNVYRVLHIAKHSETLEEMVVYQAMYGERGIWVRPKAMFEEVLKLAKSEGISQVRLYVDKDNNKAQTVYHKSGMSECHYLMYEVNYKN